MRHVMLIISLSLLMACGDDAEPKSQEPSECPSAFRGPCDEIGARYCVDSRRVTCQQGPEPDVFCEMVVEDCAGNEERTDCVLNENAPSFEDPTSCELPETL